MKARAASLPLGRVRFWWGRSLAGQFVVLLLLALLAAQGLTFLITWGDQRKVIRSIYDTEFVSRAATVVDLFETTPAASRRDVIVAGGTTMTRFWLDEAPPKDASAWMREAVAQISRPLRSLAQDPPAASPSGASPSAAINPRMSAQPVAIADVLRDIGEEGVEFPAGSRFYRFSEDVGMGAAIPLADGTWLNSAYHKKLPSRVWNIQTLLSLAFTVTLISLLGLLTARRIGRPLRQMARAAEALGRGEATERLPEAGPDDIRLTCEAFNRMQERLTRFVADRTRMLAAISHDLRTPITSLRLRAEYVDDETVRGKLLQTIGEMEAMTKATLSFAREEAATEPTRPVELCSFIETVCHDLIELGQEVAFDESERVLYRCRPAALRRAVRNLVENALRYAGHARVAVATGSDGVRITVSDSGPGIPENMVEEVFSPFFRLEQSRNRQTGGVGLGLAIVRAIVRQHGGDVRLRSNEPGLVATILLPEQPASTLLELSA